MLLTGLRKMSFAVAHRRRSRTACVVSVDADPLGLVLRLNELESIKWAHVARVLPRCSCLAASRFPLRCLPC